MGNNKTKGRCLANDDPKNQWGFCPNEAAALIFTVIFGLLTLTHLFQAFYYKKKFCWVIVMASSWETAGLICRVLGSRDQSVSSFDLASNLLVLLSPLWINAFVYMVFGRAMYFWIPAKKLAKLKARTVTKWFVWTDVTIFIVQATGGSMLDDDDPQTAKNGLNIYEGGLGAQMFVVFVFYGLLFKFWKEASIVGKQRDRSWKPIVWAIIVALLLITVRIIFRLIEFNSGTSGYIPTHEVFFYLLEATPMSLAIFAFVLIHPGRFMQGEESEFSKLIIKRGKRNWWCCGRRSKTKIDPDFELEQWNGRASGASSTPLRKTRHHRRHHSRGQVDYEADIEGSGQ